MHAFIILFYILHIHFYGSMPILGLIWYIFIYRAYKRLLWLENVIQGVLEGKRPSFELRYSSNAAIFCSIARNFVRPTQ